MKKILFIPLLLVGFAVYAIPEKIYPKTKILKSVGWYTEQVSEWGTFLQNHSSDADAWLNFYAASRFAQQDDSHLNLIVERMKRSIPNTFEYFLIQGWHGGFDDDAIRYLTKAYELKPEHSGSYGLLMQASEFEGNHENRLRYAKKMHEAGILSTSLLNYSYNVLMSVDAEAVLFTEGENTTLPLLALQDIWNVRPDVTVLNLDMMTYSHYRKSKFESSNLILNTIADSDPDFKQLLCAALPVENAGRKFYYALTLTKDNITSLKDQLYVVGLASQLSQTRIDNISLIRENLEKRFLMDYLSVDFNGTSQFDTGNVLSANYLVPFLLLYEHYQKNADIVKLAELEVMIHRIAVNAHKEELVNNFLNRNKSDEIPYFPANLSAKTLEGRFRPISNRIFAEESEVRNEQYNQFLAYLIKNNLNDLYEKYKFDLTAYDEPALSMMKNYTAARIATKKEKYFTQYPAVNISYEGAVAYCAWLTDQYNNSAEKKYKKVKFRLPTIQEFQIAAASIKNPTSWNLNEQTIETKVFPEGKEFSKDFEIKKVSGGDPEMLYPWFRIYFLRNSPRNNKGCYLGNFKTLDNEKPCMPERMTSGDGWMMMGPVETYFPNDIGLYDVVGNVAEMTNEKGKACGGSWNHPAEESTIKSINVYNGPDSAIGFRVFMEIIEP